MIFICTISNTYQRGIHRKTPQGPRQLEYVLLLKENKLVGPWWCERLDLQEGQWRGAHLHNQSPLTAA